MHVEKSYNSSFRGLFLLMSLCFNLFIIGPSCGSGTSDVSDRRVMLMLGGGVSIIMQPSANFFQEPGLLDCIAGYIWSSYIFSYQALFGLWQKMSTAVSKF